jgi:hypothetical protein
MLTYQSIQPTANRLDPIPHRPPHMLRNLDHIAPDLKVIIEQRKDGREWPHAGPHDNVAELRHHLCIVGYTVSPRISSRRFANGQVRMTH